MHVHQVRTAGSGKAVFGTSTWFRIDWSSGGVSGIGLHTPQVILSCDLSGSDNLGDHPPLHRCSRDDLLFVEEIDEWQRGL